MMPVYYVLDEETQLHAFLRNKKRNDLKIL